MMANADATTGQLYRLELEISATLITRYRETKLARQLGPLSRRMAAHAEIEFHGGCWR